MLKIRTITTALSAAFLAIALPTSGQAAEAPTVSEAFGCNFNEGKGIADLDKAIDYYKATRKQIESPELQKMLSRVWTPFLGSVPVDFVWFNGNMTLVEWGKITDVMVKSKRGKAIQAKFDEVATCSSSSLSTNEILVNTEKDFADDGEVTIESYRCRLHPGKGIFDSDAALDAWKPPFQKAIKATNSASVVVRRLPIISGSGFDLSYLVVWDDATALAVGNSTFDADPNSAKSDQLFEAAHRCESALFTSRTVVQPGE